MENTLISVVGPTAIGKTKAAIALAKYFKADIISADSRQFYKEMEIGTAVPSKTELEAATHHFIQHKSITEEYSVGHFERDALSLLESLFSSNSIVIMVGGSGLYIDAVTKGLNYFPKVDDSIREMLNIELEHKGIEALQQKLKQLDPEYYKKVDLENPHRLIRALEICIGSGETYSSFLNKPKPKRSFKVLTIGIDAERKTIYDRINLRVDIMMQQGLLNEVKGLLAYRKGNALQTVGYKELFNYLDHTWELDFSVSEIKKNTRRFAKRQLTWFRKNIETLWVPYDLPENEMVHIVSQKLKTKP